MYVWFWTSQDLKSESIPLGPSWSAAQNHTAEQPWLRKLCPNLNHCKPHPTPVTTQEKMDEPCGNLIKIQISPLFQQTVGGLQWWWILKISLQDKWPSWCKSISQYASWTRNSIWNLFHPDLSDIKIGCASNSICNFLKRTIQQIAHFTHWLVRCLWSSLFVCETSATWWMSWRDCPKTCVVILIWTVHCI